MHACMYACMYVCMHACMYVFVCIHMYPTFNTTPVLHIPYGFRLSRGLKFRVEGLAFFRDHPYTH